MTFAFDSIFTRSTFVLIFSLDKGIGYEQCTFTIDTSIDQFERAARVSRKSGIFISFFY